MLDDEFIEKDLFVEYQRFIDSQSVKDMVEILETNAIPYELENYETAFNPLFARATADSLNREYCLKIRKHDFSKLETILNELSKIELGNADPDYYLFSFTNEQLQEIIINKDEWNQYDFLLAKQILGERGFKITDEMIESYKKARIEKLSEPEKSLGIWIYVGYVSSIIGGILGIILGTHIVTSKKTLPNGERIYSYSERDRKQGYAILILGIIFFIPILILKIMKEIAMSRY